MKRFSATLLGSLLSVGFLGVAAFGYAAEPVAPPAPAQTGTTAMPAPTLESLIDGAHRSDQNKARNKYRHPVETLTFFGLKPDMTVVEIWPSKGWYTEVIAPYVAQDGQYYGAVLAPKSDQPEGQSVQQYLLAKFAAAPNLYKGAKISVSASPEKPDLGPAGSADMVLTFRNMHNWLEGGTTSVMLKAVYRTLKPGGIFGVVDHRGNSLTPQDPKAASGYINQEYAIKLIEKAGFKLVDASEINANSRDTKDYPGGVWTLPPTLKLKDKDQAKYLRIGESDRFTLKFIKPLKAHK